MFWSGLGLEIRIVLALAFLLAAVSKIVRPSISEQLDLLRTVGLSGSIVRVAVRLFPGVEILLCIYLMGPWFPVIALWSAIGMLFGFSAVMWMAIVRGHTGGCGCFGTSKKAKLGVANLFLNGLLITTGFFAIAAESMEVRRLSILNTSMVDFAAIAILGIFLIASFKLAQQFDALLEQFNGGNGAGQPTNDP